MLPIALKSDYKEYKEDTNAIASWLASTAKLCGYSADLLSKAAQQTAVTTSRLKGKERKDARERNKAAFGAPQRLQKRIIAIKDFVPLAEFISASKKPVIVVPESLMNTLNRVIAIRSHFGLRMAKAGVPETEESAASHGYFIGVLQEVQSIFEARIAETARVDPATAPGPAQKGFSPLAVYETSKEFADAPNAIVKKSEKAPIDEVVYEAEPPASWEDAVTTYGLMMQDMVQIRGQIMDMWKLYIKECRDLASVAVAINTATDFARLIMEDAEPIFRNHGGVLTVVDKFINSYVVEKTREAMREDMTKRVYMRFGYYDVSNEYFLSSSQFVTELAGLGVPDHVRLARRDIVPFYNPQNDMNKLHPQEKLAEDKAILTQYWSEADVLARYVSDYPVEDEFTRGMRELNRTGTVPFMLVFAAQVLLDLHHLSRRNVEHAYMSLEFELTTLKMFVDKFFYVHRDVTTPRWTAAKKGKLHQLQCSVASFIDDPVLKAKTENQGARRNSVTREKHYILRQNPLLAGLVLFHFRAGALENGLEVVNAWGTLAVPAHLYNAVRQEKLSKRIWPDMEILINALGESRFFPGGRPTQRGVYFDRYAIQMGVSASNFSPTGRKADKRARNKRNKTSEVLAKNGTRKLENIAPVSCMFMDRYWRRTGQITWTPEHIEEVLSYSQYDNDADGADFSAQRIIDVQKLRERRRGKPAGEVAPKDLVASLLSALQSEALEFTFPYLGMHQMCAEVLQMISETCRPQLSLSFPGFVEPKNGFIMYPTAAILRLAQGVNGYVDLTPLKKVADLLEAEYGTRGSAAYVVLKQAVTGWKGLKKVRGDDDMIVASLIHSNPTL
ncbi:hypothetical protein B0T10DRAFT_457564 [Thelonectria olida]|uniref:DUF6604 domain-containing protein n=1 Tax=Thelonectria olida TaxID=1576542 RepID=A0A9P9ASI0_9HYPO|nr:hypothetical protein B0T10DRAFT_457564 [Thelonectria olida]